MSVSKIRTSTTKDPGKRHKWIGPVLFLLLVLCGILYCIRPAAQEERILLSGQPADISSLSGENALYRIPATECLEYHANTRTVTGGAEGVAHIFCYDGWKKTDYTIRVFTAAVPEKLSFQFPLGHTGMLDEENSGFPITYESSDPSIVSISDDGGFSCDSPGTAQITETLNDYLPYTYSINVLKPEINYSEYVLYAGDTLALALKNCEKPFTWKTKDASIVSVSDSGVVTAESVGETTVFAKINGEKYRCEIQVEANPTVPSVIEMYIGNDPLQLEVEHSIETPVFSSDDETVVSIDENGLITASGEGETIIRTRIRDHELQTKIAVLVYDPQAIFDKTNYTQLSDLSNGVKALIGCGNYYNARLLSGIKNGEKWVYSNSSKYVAQRTTFDAMTQRRYKGANCASIANWAFMDMGIIPKGYRFYGDENGNIEHYNSGDTNCKKYLDAACEIINAHNKTFSQLYKEGKIKTGDIMTARYHTFIYRGDSSFFSCGHDAKWHKDKTAHTEDKHKAVFDNWVRSVKGSGNRNVKVKYIIRIKDSYEPKSYRNTEGKITENPVLDPVVPEPEVFYETME